MSIQKNYSTFTEDQIVEINVEQGEIAFQVLDLLEKKRVKGDVGATTTEVYVVLADWFNLNEPQRHVRYCNQNIVWNALVRAAKHNKLKKVGYVTQNISGFWIITQKGSWKLIELQELGETAI